MKKNIVICADGTGNTTIKGRGTNVFKLYEAVDQIGHRYKPGLTPQVALYHDGVGTESVKWLRLLTGATGWGLSRNVKQLYGELARCYAPGDKIFLFGFSHGAFTIRTLAGLINACGILDLSKYDTNADFDRGIDRAYAEYRKQYNSWLTSLFHRTRKLDAARVAELRRQFSVRVPEFEPGAKGKLIEFMGVWDTVDAVGLPVRAADFVNTVIYNFKFPDRTLNTSVAHACHALALDEERESFKPVLWNEAATTEPGRIEQVWFAGVHSNVGGGYPRQGMSLVALDWMLVHAQNAGLRMQALDREIIKGHASVDDKLYDPRAGAGLFYSWGPRKIGELCEANGVAPKIHLTAIERIAHGTEDYAPGVIPDGAVVVTTTTDDPEANAATEMRARAVQKILDKALADRPTLMREAAPAMKVGRLSYWLFMLSWLALIIGAVGVTMETIPGPLTVGRMIKGV